MQKCAFLHCSIFLFLFLFVNIQRETAGGLYHASIDLCNIYLLKSLEKCMRTHSNEMTKQTQHKYHKIQFYVFTKFTLDNKFNECSSVFKTKNAVRRQTFSNIFKRIFCYIVTMALCFLLSDFIVGIQYKIPKMLVAFKMLHMKYIFFINFHSICFSAISCEFF